ncbi:BCCT family transporter [Streptomyces sp. ST2-7A]|uniref:BCCT family transporter n=1 Tax=Streptomyces sp. ST2-7A TaxID=2907214 RepID=UPI001F259059|nr:BCCT family transporter [Streptomyces sp. ST2-7A]MCE7083101.1 BCCT family transporter [Streptomyces sp. ST2-7A]
MTAFLDRLGRRLGLRTDTVIFFVSAGLTVAFVAVAIALTETVDRVFRNLSGWILANLGWLYILGVTTFLLFLVWIALSRWGHVRLGGHDARPEYGNRAWFAMLFAAGIGTILMFWGVAEPISHWAEPPRADVEPRSEEAAELAMAFSFYHFGLHTWAIFCLPALAFAYFVHQRRLPFRLSSVLQPLLGDRIHGPLGRAVDITAVLGTLFGVAVSIGLGTLQINSGLAQLFGLEESQRVQVLLITVVTIIATISVALGLDRGIKRLSTLNIGMAIGLLIFVFLTGATVFLARGVIEMIGVYLGSLVPLAFWNDAFANTGWQGQWTVFYWAWTITWSPFVGMFIARISRGRTIRGFVLGVLGLPTAFTIIWFSIFGLSAIDIEREGDTGLVEAVVVQGDVSRALFVFLENYPLATLVSAVSVLIVVIFFTTSSDSASLVVDTLCSGDREEPGPVRQRVFWAITEGVVAGTLIAATGKSGLDALAEVITVLGLPFFLLAFLMMISLVRALNTDYPELRRPQLPRSIRRMPRSAQRARPTAGGPVPGPGPGPGDTPGAPPGERPIGGD